MKTCTIKHTILALLLGFTFFSACKKDKDTTVELTLEKSSLELFTDDQVPVKIVSGNGGYTAASSSEEIAVAETSDQTITIMGKAKGTAMITVKDNKGKTATISVTVNAAIIDATTPRFKWENTIELEKANGWGTAILTDRVAVTNLTDKKQFVLSWTGGYTVGEKTAAKLQIVEEGAETQEVALSGLEVQSAENNIYSIIFNKDAQKGELVVTH